MEMDMVGAGDVANRKFDDNYMIGSNPAKVIKA